MSSSPQALPPTPLPDGNRIRRAREWFERLRSEGGAHLPPFTAPTIDDDTLTPPQRAAVARAISTPDVCLIETDAETGRLLAAAISRHAASRGESVLLVADEGSASQFVFDDSKAPAASQTVAKLADLKSLVDARQASRWWSPLFWRALFRPGLMDEYQKALAEAGPHLTLPKSVSVFTPDGIAGDPRTWDRLVVCSAHQLDRRFFAAHCARADRWVFIGMNLGKHIDQADDLAAAWHALASETWTRENGRLCCRIRQLSLSEREAVTVEPLSDAPEIELRFFEPAEGAPELAEVLFPSSMSLIAAKEFLARELDEWPIDLDLGSLQWIEKDNQLTACGKCLGKIEPVPVELNPGVREIVSERPDSAESWSTCGVSFDRTAGWDRAKAELWLQTHCPNRIRRALRL